MGKSDEFRNEIEDFFSRSSRQMLELSNRCDRLEKENKELKKLVQSCVAILAREASSESKQEAIRTIDKFQDNINLKEKSKNNSGPSLPGNVLL